MYIPTGYDGAKRLPVVFDVHGYTSWADEQLTRSKWGQMADKEGFVVIDPEGVNKSWNAGSCCGGNNQDDVGFFRAIVKKATADLCIDSKRVYVSGHSNGGAMTYRLGCEAADIFAAIAPVCGWMTISNCNPARPIPVLAIRGLNDSTVTINTADGDITEWLSNDQCSRTPVTTSGVCKTYTACAAGTQVMDCRPRGGHDFFYGNNPDATWCPTMPGPSSSSSRCHEPHMTALDGQRRYPAGRSLFDPSPPVRLAPRSASRPNVSEPAPMKGSASLRHSL